MVLCEILKNSQENICSAIFFFNKVKNEALAQVFSCKFCKIRKNTFLQNTTRLLLIIAVSKVNYFRKKAPSQIFDSVENRLKAKSLKYWAHSCSQSSNSAEKILSQKICVTLFLKTRKVFMQNQPSKGFFEKGVIRNFVEFTRKHVRESLSLIKLNSIDLQLL